MLIQVGKRQTTTTGNRIKTQRIQGNHSVDFNSSSIVSVYFCIVLASLIGTAASTSNCT